MNYIHIRNLQWYDSKMINLIFFPAKCNLNIPFRLFIRDIIARNTHTLCVLTVNIGFVPIDGEHVK